MPKQIITCNIKDICEIAVEAGKSIMEFYEDKVKIDFKKDNSPLTIADRTAHNIIIKAIKELTPEIPVLSEESDQKDIKSRKDWKTFWLVDPLDGTKEFIKKTDEFTVNIALIHNGISKMGVIYIPAQEILYFASEENGSFKCDLRSNQTIKIQSRKLNTKEIIIVASRDHAGPGIEKMIRSLPGNVKKISMGSSLKFCLIAEGKADIYLRDKPTMEWDTAAAQAIIENAGGKLTDLNNKVLFYNKDSLTNPLILAWGDIEFNVHNYVY